MATLEELEEVAKNNQISFAEAMEKYNPLYVNHDPVHGSFIVMAERTTDISSDLAMSELGYSSPSPWTAWTREERVPELRDRKGLRTFYDMKRADGTVRGALRLLKTPVMSARWFVEPATDSTVDKNIAQYVEDNLFRRLNVPWSRVVEDALLMCEYGYMPFEKVYDYDPLNPGKIMLTKLAPRHPMDVREWMWDANGGPDGLVMEPLEIGGIPGGRGSNFTPGYNVPSAALLNPGLDNLNLGVFIPINKLVIFVLEQEAGDLRGISILRSAYKHYFYKDCVSADTEVLTRRGWLTQEKLNQTDQVLTINPETGLSEWNDVLYVRRYPGTHDVIEMESQSLSAITTPDHRWLTKDSTWAAPYKYLTSQELRQRHIIPKAALNAQIPTAAKYTDDLVELVGWFTTEGSWDGAGARIVQNYDSPHIDRIRASLTGLFGSAYKPNTLNRGRRDLAPGWYEHAHTTKPETCQFRLNKAATATIQEFVQGTDKVVADEFIFNLTKAQLELFLSTCLNGDGCGQNEIRQTVSARLEPIALTCILLGYGVSFHNWQHPDPKYPNTTVYQLTIARERIGAKPVQAAARYGATFERTTYDGIVWCPKTTNGNWLARRNGKVYYTGNTFYKIDAIQKERHGVGVPIIKLPPGFSAVDKQLAENLGRNLRTNERAHIVIPNNWEVLFAKLEGQPVDCMRSIDHHDLKIKSNILAPFMDEANVKPDSLDIYFKSTRYIASTICDTFNHHVIPQLKDINFSRGGYPKLRVRRIGEWEDVRTMSFAFRNFVGAGAIRPDDELEEFLRSELDLPPVDKSSIRMPQTPQLANTQKSQEAKPPRQSTAKANAPGANSGTDQSGG